MSASKKRNSQGKDQGRNYDKLYGGRKKDKYEIVYSEFKTSNGREVLYFRDLQLCVPWHKWGPTLFVSTLNSLDRKLFL